MRAETKRELKAQRKAPPKGANEPGLYGARLGMRLNQRGKLVLCQIGKMRLVR